MQISFRPALGETISVSSPPCAAPAQFYFTATFASRKDHEEYSQAGVRVELWSDIVGDGQWAGQTFQDCQPPSKMDPARHLTASLSLECENNSHDEGVSGNTLSLLFSTPKDTLEYTYRLVYPSGQIVWLGNASNNGRIVLDRSNPLLFLRNGWSGPDPTTRAASALYEAKGQLLDSTGVAKLNLDVGRECAIWALGNDGLVGSFPAPISSASLIFVVPRIRAGNIALPPAFAMISSPGSSISLDSQGGIAFTGPGDSSLILQTYNPGSDLKVFMERVLSATSHPLHRFQLLDYEPMSGHAVVASPQNTYPGSVLIIQIFPTPSKTGTHIGIHNLATLLPNVSRFSLFSPANFRTCFIEDPNSADDDTALFTTGTTGGYFVIAPMHGLGEDGAWDVSILTPHLPPPNVEHVLPTPPDSPTLRPIAHLTSQRSAKSSTMSILSLSDMSIALTDRLPLNARGAPARTWMAQLAPVAKHSLAVALMVFRALLNLLLGTFFTRNIIGARNTVSGPRETVLDATHDAEIHSDPRPQSPAVVTPTNVPSALETHTPCYFNTHSGHVSILLRSRQVNASVHDVAIEFDGRIVDCNVKEIGEGIFLVEFDGGVNGGWVKVSLR